MWVITVNDKYYLRSLSIKRVKGKLLTKDDFEVTEHINHAYLFETELGCLAMMVFLTSLHLVHHEFRMFNVKELIYDRASQSCSITNKQIAYS